MSGEILVVRNEAMERAWDESGYFVDSEGYGPFSVLYEKMKRSETRMTATVDPYARQGYGFEPYEVTVLGRGLSLVTLVTADLEENPSTALIESFIRSLSA
ncbi:hypothetical protein ACQP2X_39290 [Actinoplanes sp. CA-131856]